MCGYGQLLVSSSHRRRIKTEEKTKVVAIVVVPLLWNECFKEWMIIQFTLHQITTLSK